MYVMKDCLHSSGLDSFDLFGSLPRRKLGVGGTLGEGAKLKTLARGVLGGSVHIRLAEDDHADVGVQIDLSGLGAGKPESQTCNN